jgi:hypothetical protein
MTRKEFDVLVLDEQKKWGPGGTGTVLFEAKGEVKLPHSEGKEKPKDPFQKATDEMYAKLAFGSSYVELPANIHATLSEAKGVKLPDGIHQKLAECFGGGTDKKLPEGIHERMRRAF